MILLKTALYLKILYSLRVDKIACVCSQPTNTSELLRAGFFALRA